MIGKTETDHNFDGKRKTTRKVQFCGTQKPENHKRDLLRCRIKLRKSKPIKNLETNISQTSFSLKDISVPKLGIGIQSC